MLSGLLTQKNPLTARVIVNRVWSWHFGQGIAGNPNNFGGTGAIPTHPELLDFLAAWFVENGWSIKKLNYLIITSQAYRRSSQHPEPQQVALKDSHGDYYAAFKQRRLSAEELRDAMLVVSGQLNREQGGIPARPDINLEVAFQPRQIMGGAASVYEPDPKPEQRNRRSIYAEKIRGVRDPFLEIFNQPGPDKSCELRETSTVAPQALTLLNADEVYDRSIGFAHGLASQALSDEATIEQAFKLAFCRAPSEQERALCLEHWKQALQEEQQQKPVSRVYPDTIQRTVMAEKTGEPYDFDEVMPAYRDYQPDLSAANVDARTRALAHVCKVLFNSNEFAYLD